MNDNESSVEYQASSEYLASSEAQMTDPQHPARIAAERNAAEPAAEQAPEHTRTGNCFLDDPYFLEPCAEHQQRRGYCRACPPCPVCSKEAVGQFHDDGSLGERQPGDVEHMIQRVAGQPDEPTKPLQSRVDDWLLACFGEAIARDRAERNHRFLEEALEVVQACGCTQSEAHQLVDYVYGRPIGEANQEVGGAIITLVALCLARDIDFTEAGETELRRIWTKVEQIRAKQAAKPKHGPLPVAEQPAPVAEDATHYYCEEGTEDDPLGGHRCQQVRDEVAAEGSEGKAALLPCPFANCETSVQGLAGLVRCYNHTEWLTPEEWNRRASIDPQSLSAEQCAQAANDLVLDGETKWEPFAQGIATLVTDRRGSEYGKYLGHSYPLRSAQIICAWYLSRGTVEGKK